MVGYVSLDEPKLLHEIVNIFFTELEYTTKDLAKVVCLSEKDVEENFIDMGKRKFRATLGNQAA